MRMLNAAITGFIALERSTDESFEVMLYGLLVAIRMPHPGVVYL